MIKKFIRKLLGKSPNPSSSRRIDHPSSSHSIDAKFVDANAARVTSALQNAHHEAYIVGGATRDLLLGLRPKDFDIATNATPEQVKSLFRRAFIIGRRFRIVHVIFGKGRTHEVIEVTTFRANVSHDNAVVVSGNERTSRVDLAKTQHAVNKTGRVLRDNVWGNLEDDAMRRDFTINALYYDPKTGVVIDFHHGLDDVKNRIIRMIGDPEKRYREDPVRMIRAIRFAAKLQKLGFMLDPATSAPLKKCQNLLKDIPQSRLFDETLKLLQTGHAFASINQLKLFEFDKNTCALLDLIVQKSDQPLIRLVLQDTDRRVNQGYSVTPSFLLASVLWSDVQTQLIAHKKHMPPHPAMNAAIADVLNGNLIDLSANGKLAGEIREIWALQLRFEKRSGKSPFTLLSLPKYRAAFDFLSLRAKTSEIEVDLVDWWQDFAQCESEDIRSDMIKMLPKSPKSPRNQGNNKAQKRSDASEARSEQDQSPKDAPEHAENTDFSELSATADTPSSTPRRNRRRRFKPSHHPATGQGGIPPKTGSDAAS